MVLSVLRSIPEAKQALMVDLIDKPVGQIASELGVSPWAIYKRRERIERKLGMLLPRLDTRGRKPRRSNSTNPQRLAG